MVDEKGWKITYKEYLMGRDKHVTPMKSELTNMHRLLTALNAFRHIYGKPMTISSGWRPSVFNKAVPGAAVQSAHITGEACDFSDPDRSLGKFCMDNLELLGKLGLYLEDLAHTPTWVHLQIRKPRSGNRVFKP